MAVLTDEQAGFLKHHKISLGSVFDATGLGRNDYRAAMKLLGKDVAIGVTPCQKGGHSLRSRSGHCVQCNSASLAFQKRYSDTGYVYVAGSRALQVLKVGFTTDIPQRISSLVSFGYAGASDWECLHWAECENAGKVEFDVHSALAVYAAPTAYIRDGKQVNCLETFSCGIETVVTALNRILRRPKSEWSFRDNWHLYNFESKTGSSFHRTGGGGNGGSSKPLHRSTTNIAQSSSARASRSHAQARLEGTNRFSTQDTAQLKIDSKASSPTSTNHDESPQVSQVDQGSSFFGSRRISPDAKAVASNQASISNRVASHPESAAIPAENRSSAFIRSLKFIAAMVLASMVARGLRILLLGS